MISTATFVLLIIVAGVTACTVVYALLLGIGPVPTSRHVRKHLATLLPQEAKHIAELGCGWGTLLRLLSRRYPKGQIAGYERSPLPCLFAWMGRWTLGLSNVSIHWEDFFSTPLHQADLVVCYLFPKAMDRLAVKFRHELQVGTCVVTHTFALPGWTPKRLIHADDLYRTPIYVYAVEEQVNGPK